MKRTITLLMFFVVSVFSLDNDTFTDSRDGKKYKTVKIGKQTWMAQNLDYHGEDGYLGLCYGAEPQKDVMKPENCKKYGRLYDWEEAKKACPRSWHLPSDAEWQTLVDFAGGDEIAGQKLKSKSGWKEHDFSGKNPKSPKCRWAEQTEKQVDNRGRVISPAGVKEYDYCATDEFGFSALPGGFGYSLGDFDDVGDYGGWWSATEDDFSNAYHRYMSYNDGRVYSDYTKSSVFMYLNLKSYLLSVRCVQD